jgi:hypothetical protein
MADAQTNLIVSQGCVLTCYVIGYTIVKVVLTCLQINLYLEQPMEVQLFATFLQRRK